LRVAALAFGVLAGLVASLILALGGLDVAADLGATAERQAQAIRFGLFVIGNLGVFGAALALAVPLAAAVFLFLGAVAWVGAALLMHHTTDLVLIVPPALLLIAAVFAVIAHVRRPRPDELDEDEFEVIAPLSSARASRGEEIDDGDGEVGIPAFAAAEARPQPDVRGAFDNGRLPPAEDDWNPRRRQTPPPRIKPAFRPIEEEYEDEEPSGLSRFALGLSGVLSFGLYAALAGAAILIVWSLRNASQEPVRVAEVPTPSVTAEAELPASSAASPVAEEPGESADQTLQPILTGEPIREIAAAPTAPSTSSSELVAATTPSEEPGRFGAAALPSGPVMVPTLADDFNNEDDIPLPEISPDPPSLSPSESFDPPSSEPGPEPKVAATEAPRVEPTVPAEGQPWPHAVPPALAAQRLATGTGPTSVVAVPANATNTGL
jgi:hypothetical protein